MNKETTRTPLKLIDAEHRAMCIRRLWRRAMPCDDGMFACVCAKCVVRTLSELVSIEQKTEIQESLASAQKPLVDSL